MLKKISPEVTAIEFHNFGSIIYLIKIKNKNILIDTSSKENSKELIQDLRKLNLSPRDIQTIILTHSHWDHIENINLFPNANIYSNAKDPIFTNREKINLDWKKIQPIEKLKIPELKIYKTPGHTQDDILILYKNILFSGDTIFHHGYIGRTNFPESDPEQMQKSLELIKTLDFEILCPGH